jgi:hypothetical protein
LPLWCSNPHLTDAQQADSIICRDLRQADTGCQTQPASSRVIADQQQSWLCRALLRVNQLTSIAQVRIDAGINDLHLDSPGPAQHIDGGAARAKSCQPSAE